MGISDRANAPGLSHTLTFSTEDWQALQDDLVERERLYVKAQELADSDAPRDAVAKVQEEIDDVHGAIAQRVARVFENQRAQPGPSRGVDPVKRSRGASKFPFEVLAFIGEDGQPVVEVETSTPGAPTYHDSRGEPYLRVWVNDDLCSEYTGPEPWSRAQRGLAQLAARLARGPARGPER